MGLILLGVGAIGFIGYLIWLIVCIRNWDSKIPSIIGMVLCLVMLCGGAETMSHTNEKSDPSKTTVGNPTEEVDTQDTLQNSEESASDALLAFDERTWKDFTGLYISHNNLMDSMEAYADGKVTALDFYNACEDFKEYFANASLSFNYGKDDEQKTYLSVFESAALADQLAAEKLMKYLDTLKISDLNEAQDEIESAKEALTMIASNRGLLLVKAGLSEDEIRERVELDMAELEQMS